MSVSVTFNGISYAIPSTGETDWGASITAFLQAVSTSTLQRSGGTFTLTAEAYFGATYGLKAPYFKTATATPATSGVVRLANTDRVSWMNAAGNGALALGPGADNILEFNSVDLVTFAEAKFDSTDSSGTPGAVIINKPSGKFAVAIGQSTCVVTNSLVTAASKVFCVLQFADATLTEIRTVVPTSGSFTFTGNANATAATKVAFFVVT